MRAVLLAAGKGSRLLTLTKDRPKILVEIGPGVTLLAKQLENMVISGVIGEVTYVVGYRADLVTQALRDLGRRYRIKLMTLYNPFFHLSNNLVSLWLAQHAFDGDVLISNGDNLFHPDIYRRFQNIREDGIHLAVSRKDEFDDDDMKVRLNGDHLLLAVDKNLDASLCAAESLGLLRIKGESQSAEFCSSMNALIRQRESLDRYWLKILNHLVGRGVPVRTIEVDGQSQWQEVDFPEDIREAAARFL